MTYTGLRVRALGLSKEVYEESLKKAESTVKMGQSLEEEGGQLQAEEERTIGRKELDLDVDLEQKARLKRIDRPVS